MPSSTPMWSNRDIEQLTTLFRLLADPTRLNLLLLLAKGDRNVSDLCAALDLPQPTVSHHLGLMRVSNIIGSRRSGKLVYYGLNGRILTNHGLQLGVENHWVRITPRTAT